MKYLPQTLTGTQDLLWGLAGVLTPSVSQNQFVIPENPKGQFYFL